MVMKPSDVGTRRGFIRLAGACGLVLLFGVGRPATAENRHALYGKWHVRCPRMHVDIVTDGTKQHKCEKCGDQCFVNGSVTVMCPNKHPNKIALGSVDVLTNYKCRRCKAECEGW
jgi:hypothetical protein